MTKLKFVPIALNLLFLITFIILKRLSYCNLDKLSDNIYLFLNKYIGLAIGLIALNSILIFFLKKEWLLKGLTLIFGVTAILLYSYYYLRCFNPY